MEIKTPVGIDLGITSFATLSTGEKIDNPRHLKTELLRLKRLQRAASRKKKGSNNHTKANLKVALLHEKIANQRKDFLNKVSTRLIRDNQTDTICVETLSIKNMVKNHKLAQAISDVSWSEFVRQLEYKGKWYGKNIIKIDRFYASSKTCSNCGNKLDQLDLSVRQWTCSNCGESHDRDVNAAINIMKSGMGSPEVPVEMSAIAESMKQESLPMKRFKKII
jgi:putative transposase